MAQIFENKGWVKQHRHNLRIRFKKLGINPNYLYYLRIFDKKDMITKNFVYLLRLNNLDERQYVNYIILIKLIFLSYYLPLVSENSKVNREDLLKNIEILRKDLIKKEFNHNYEKTFFRNNTLEKEELDVFCNYHELYNAIANIYLQPFINNELAFNYYRYGYLLTLVLNLTVLTKLMNCKNVELYQIRLKAFNTYQYEISMITKNYFNYFLKINNYFLHKIR